MNGRFLTVALDRVNGTHQLFHTTSLPYEQCVAVAQANCGAGVCVLILEAHNNLGEDAPAPPQRPTFSVVKP